jgi:uncharacterized OB-fold protein
VSLPLQVCTDCGRAAFPDRLLCPCGSRSFRREDADGGVVEEVTTVRRVPGRTLEEPVRVATIAVGAVRVIARLESDARDVALSLDRGAPVAR